MNNCKEIKDCGCNQIEFCGCSDPVGMQCVKYEGERILPLNIRPGMGSDEILRKINEVLWKLTQGIPNYPDSQTAIDSGETTGNIYYDTSTGSIKQVQ